MPWTECNKMDQKIKFISRLIDGEKMAHSTIIVILS
jgi:hypothetical protein